MAVAEPVIPMWPIQPSVILDAVDREVMRRASRGVRQDPHPAL